MPNLADSRRWLLLPIAAVGGCAGSLAVTGAVGHGVERALTPGRVEALLPLDLRVALAYAAAAVVFVVAGTLVAPKHRAVAAAVLYALGASLAWTILRHWYFPEFHPRAYQMSIVPLVLTLAGGGLGVLGVIALDRYRRSHAVEREARSGSAA